jgi:hypothetical protein
MNNETLFAIRLVFKIIDKVLKFLDPSELFFNTKVTNLYQRFLVFDSHVNSAQSNSVLHVHGVVLVLNTIETLSSQHSTEHHHGVVALPAVDRESTR